MEIKEEEREEGEAEGKGRENEKGECTLMNSASSSVGSSSGISGS